MRSHNVRGAWIKRHAIPVRDLKNCLALDAQLTFAAGQDCESRVETDAGNCFTLKVQIHVDRLTRKWIWNGAVLEGEAQQFS